MFFCLDHFYLNSYSVLSISFIHFSIKHHGAYKKKTNLTREDMSKKKREAEKARLEKNLHEKFLKTVPFTISYSLFTRFRLFWVVPPTLSNRDTCMVHENMDRQLTALKKANILTTVSNYQTMLKMLCYNRYSERWVLLKNFTLREFDTTKPILLQQRWSKKESIID